MKKVAVIIKHPFRDKDFRIDIYSVPDSYGYEQIYDYVMSRMLGPFEVIGMTSRIGYDLEIKPDYTHATNNV